VNVALFGATGRTGRRVLALALGRGDRVAALVGDASRLAPHAALRTIEGDSRDAAAVARTIEGADAVLCCLGLRDIGAPTTEFSDSVREIVSAMRTRSVRRIVAIASAGVLPDARGGLRLEHAPGGPYRHVNAEHARNYATLAGSGLDWTLLCAVDLKDDIPAGHARLAVEDLPPGSGETGYADLAATMLALAGDAASFARRVGIVSVR
jgi:putative NADH-flavin reductase